MPQILYILIILLEIIFLASFSAFMASLIYSGIMGAPYVATNTKLIKRILSQIKYEKGALFYELGSGRGYVVSLAVKKYSLKGIGIDVNPLLNFLARSSAKLKKIDNIKFIKNNIFDVSLKKANYVYVFLMPKLLRRLVPKFNRELKNKTIIISHGFKIPGWDSLIFKTLKDEPFPTYYYRYKKTS